MSSAIALTLTNAFTNLIRRAAGWSSQVARRAHNPKVAGSNPAPATMVRAVAPSAITPQIVSALSVFRVFLIQFISAMKPLIRIRGQCEEQERARRPTQLQPLALLAKCTLYDVVAKEAGLTAPPTVKARHEALSTSTACLQHLKSVRLERSAGRP